MGQPGAETLNHDYLYQEQEESFIILAHPLWPRWHVVFYFSENQLKARPLGAFEPSPKKIVVLSGTGAN